MLLLFREVRSFQANGKRPLKTVFSTSDRRAQRRMLWAALPFFVLMPALFMTASRAGVVFSLLGLILFAFVVFWWRHLKRPSMILATIGAVLLALALLQFAGSVGARSNESGIGDASSI